MYIVQGLFKVCSVKSKAKAVQLFHSFYFSVCRPWIVCTWSVCFYLCRVQLFCVIEGFKENFPSTTTSVIHYSCLFNFWTK